MGNAHACELERQLPRELVAPSYPGAGDANYTFASGSLQYSFNGVVGKCDVAGSGTIDLGSQPDYQNYPLLRLDFASPPRKYNLQVPAPLLATVPGTTSNCDDPNDNGDFNWSPGAGAPWMAYAPYPAGPGGGRLEQLRGRAAAAG